MRSYFLQVLTGGFCCLTLAACTNEHRLTENVKSTTPLISRAVTSSYQPRYIAQGVWAFSPNCLATVSSDLFSISIQKKDAYLTYSVNCHTHSGNTCSASRLKLRFTHDSALWYQTLSRKRTSFFSSTVLNNEKTQSQLLVALEGGKFDLYIVSKSSPHIATITFNPRDEDASKWFRCVRN